MQIVVGWDRELLGRGLQLMEPRTIPFSGGKVQVILTFMFYIVGNEHTQIELSSVHYLPELDANLISLGWCRGWDRESCVCRYGSSCIKVPGIIVVLVVCNRNIRYSFDSLLGMYFLPFWALLWVGCPIEWTFSFQKMSDMCALKESIWRISLRSRIFYCL